MNGFRRLLLYAGKCFWKTKEIFLATEIVMVYDKSPKAENDSSKMPSKRPDLFKTYLLVLGQELQHKTTEESMAV